MKKKALLLAFCLLLQMVFIPSAGATQSRTGNFVRTYTLTGDGATDMVNIAKAQLGRTGAQMGYTEEWCADFISDCAILAGQSAAVPAHGRVEDFYPLLLSAGGSVVSAANARAGDICFINWDGGTRKAHVELITSASGGKISTVGGNTGTGSNYSTRQVKQHAPLSSNYIVAIIRPNYSSDCPSRQFTDVPAVSDWAHAGIDYAVSSGLMDGVGNNRFDPNGTMTRAMFVTVLHRSMGAPIWGQNTFTDVPDGEWYTSAVAWAVSNHIVDGVGNNRFDPNGYVTREQLAVMFYRCCRNFSIDTGKRASLTAYSDAGDVSAYAREAMQWAVAEGIIEGSGGKLRPQNLATRAEVATIFQRFIENIVN